LIPNRESRQLNRVEQHKRGKVFPEFGVLSNSKGGDITDTGAESQ
jgi:hypothetical protein